MGVFEDFVGFFFTWTGLFSMAIVGGLIIVVAYFVSSKIRATKDVLLLRPRDRRGVTLRVARETDRGLICHKYRGPIWRFIKTGPGWSFLEDSRRGTKFIGIEGTAYTSSIQGGSTEEISVKDYLRLLWGDDEYAKIPEPLKKTVEDDKIGVTVEPQQFDIADLPQYTSEDMHNEEDTVIMGKLAKAHQTSTTKDFFMVAVGAGLGMLLLIVLESYGILNIVS